MTDVKLWIIAILETILLLAKKSSGSFNKVIYKMYLEIIYLVCMYKKDLALNSLP